MPNLHCGLMDYAIEKGSSFYLSRNKRYLFPMYLSQDFAVWCNYENSDTTKKLEHNHIMWQVLFMEIKPRQNIEHQW